MRPSRGNGITTHIVDENCKILDAAGSQIQGSLPNGYTSTCADAELRLRILEGDLDMDCDVDVVDDQAIAWRFGSVPGVPYHNLDGESGELYEEWYDAGGEWPDGEIDIIDEQYVFSRNWSTCQNPIPDYQALPQQAPPPPAPPSDISVDMTVVSDGLKRGRNTGHRLRS